MSNAVSRAPKDSPTISVRPSGVITSRSGNARSRRDDAHVAVGSTSTSVGRRAARAAVQVEAEVADVRAARARRRPCRCSGSRRAARGRRPRAGRRARGAGAGGRASRPRAAGRRAASRARTGTRATSTTRLRAAVEVDADHAPSRACPRTRACRRASADLRGSTDRRAGAWCRTACGDRLASTSPASTRVFVLHHRLGCAPHPSRRSSVRVGGLPAARMSRGSTARSRSSPAPPAGSASRSRVGSHDAEPS